MKHSPNVLFLDLRNIKLHFLFSNPEMDRKTCCCWVWRVAVVLLVLETLATTATAMETSTDRGALISRSSPLARGRDDFSSACRPRARTNLLLLPFTLIAGVRVRVDAAAARREAVSALVGGRPTVVDVPKGAAALPAGRPPPGQRRFVSTAVDRVITDYTQRMVRALSHTAHATMLRGRLTSQ
jgi:hypothetical protein